MPFTTLTVLLQTTESLIGAHRSAKLYGDPTAVKLIEAAMFYVGCRLSEESGQRVGHDIFALHPEKPSRSSDGDR